MANGGLGQLYASSTDRTRSDHPDSDDLLRQSFSVRLDDDGHPVLRR